MTAKRIEQVRKVVQEKVMSESKKAEYARIFEIGANWADEHPENPWISVNDRQPEDGQQILEAYTMECTAAGNKLINEEILLSFYRGKFVCDGKETNYGIGKSKSTTHHWMPIPKLPKGE